jgi:hypothetical protein
MQEKTYTFTECCSILDVSPKTFRKWLVLAGINATEQVSSADSRVKRLTFEQLTTLAEQHERLLALPPDEQQEQAESPTRDVMTIIRDALDLIEQRLQQLEQDRDILSRQIAALQHTIERQAQPLPTVQPVSLRAFADLHRLNSNAAFKTWLDGNTLIKDADIVEKKTSRGKTNDLILNESGQRNFHITFRAHPDFCANDDCPICKLV